MTQSIRQLVKQSSVYYIGTMVISLSSFISLPILTRIMSKSEYGMLSLVTLTIFLVLVPAKFGLQNSAVFYFDEFKLNKRGNRTETYYSTLFWGSLFIALSIAVIFFVAGGELLKYLPNKSLVDFIAIIAVLVVTEAMIVRIKNFLRIEQKSALFVWIGIIRSYGRIATGLLYFYFISRTVQGFLIGTLLTNVVLLILSPLFMEWFKEIKITSFSSKFLKECLHYGYPFIGIEAAALLIKYSDRYLIDYFLGTSEVGVYSVSGNLCMSISTGIFSSIWLALTPMYMKIYRTEGEEKTSEFVSKSLNILFLISIPVVFGLSAISREVIQILASKKFMEAASVIPFLVAGAAIWGVIPLYATGFYIKKRINLYNRIIAFSMFLNIAMNVYMIPRWGLQGAAIATLITYIIALVLTVKVAFNYLKVDTDFLALFHYLLAGIGMYLVLSEMDIDVNIFNLVLKIIVGALLYLFVVWSINKKLRISIKKVFLK
ncbi:MAG: oligosaccharide flippase family protein [Nitrospirota bacterium]|nr:oligosaccharide flippase family protein [Nitrospirota bacterium]